MRGRGETESGKGGQWRAEGRGWKRRAEGEMWQKREGWGGSGGALSG